MESKMAERVKVNFHFQPYDFDHQQHAVEKADTEGHTRRYLSGVASGTRTDMHGERMTQKCVESFMDQANSGDILLYPDVHGVKFTEDIGIMKAARILPNGDWYTEFRLYDEYDDVDARSIEIANKLWKQVNGLSPYTKPKQKGFSIEGYVPEDGIVEMDEFGGRRVMDNVLLDGVVVVPRPAYQDSIAHAIYKALGETPPWVTENKISKSLRSIIEEEQIENMYFRKKFAAEEAFEDLITDIMNSNAVNKSEQVDRVVAEYGQILRELVLKSESVFKVEKREAVGSPYRASKPDKQTLFNQLFKELGKLEKIQKERANAWS